jgi:hypothetical protein
VACEFTFGLEPILQITAGFFTAFEINFVCATLDFLLTCRVHYGRFFFPALWGRFLDCLLVLSDIFVCLISCFRGGSGRR